MTVTALKPRHDQAARDLLRLRALLGNEAKYFALRVACEASLPDSRIGPPTKEEFDKAVNLSIALLYEAAHAISAERPIMASDIGP